MLLIYDAKCGFCNELALKLRDAARREPIELRPLTDPVARETLDRFYPDGWEHNFYVVRGDRCRSGAGAFRPLLRSVGAPTMTRALLDYTRFRTQQRRCPVEAEATKGFSRRSVLTAGALAPLSAVLGRLPSLPARSDVPATDLAVAQARVTSGPGGFSVTTRALPDAVREHEHFDSTDGPTDVRSTTLDQVSLVDEPYGSSGRIKVRRTLTEYVRDVDGETLRAEAQTHMAMLDADRFSVVVDIGRGPVVTTEGVFPLVMMSAMVRFDNPYPVVDSVVVEPKGSAADQLLGYAAGVASLADHHRAAGRTEVAALYRDVAAGIEALAGRLRTVAPASLAPVSGELVLAPTKDSMRYVALPPDAGVIVPVPPEVVQAWEAIDGVLINTPAVEAELAGKKTCKCQCECGCNCCCQCSCGCGCECGFGCCNCSCGCGCCCGCGCDCSCGCGCCYSNSMLSDAELLAMGVPARRYLTL
jgi:hypothetical protein